MTAPYARDLRPVGVVNNDSGGFVLADGNLKYFYARTTPTRPNAGAGEHVYEHEGRFTLVTPAVGNPECRRLENNVFRGHQDSRFPFVLDRCLQKGESLVHGYTCANIYLARMSRRGWGLPVGTRVVVKFSAARDCKERIDREVDGYRAVGYHPHVAQIYASFDDLATTMRGFVMEHVGDHDGFHALEQRRFRGVELDRFVRDTAAAIEWCHRQGVAHMDLKPENMVFSPRSGTWKLIDFGWSYHSGYKDIGVGTIQYAAPEFAGGGHVNPFQADMFSLGVAIYVVITGKYAFPASLRLRPQSTRRLLGRIGIVMRDVLKPQQLAALRRSLSEFGHQRGTAAAFYDKW